MHDAFELSTAKLNPTKLSASIPAKSLPLSARAGLSSLVATRLRRMGVMACSCTVFFFSGISSLWAEDAASVDARLSKAVQYLASDELEGRGIGTKGLDLAADYLRVQFEEIGLKTALYDGTPFQKFRLTTSAKLGEPNEMKFIGPKKKDGSGQNIELKLHDDFSPLSIGGSGSLNMPIVFAGYGITSRDENYDDYADIDVKGKAVIVLRHEPQQKNPHGPFEGSNHSRHSFFSTKVSNAFQHGAAAVILVTDEIELADRTQAATDRWQEALEELVARQAEFKKLEKPTREQLDAHRADTDRLAGQIAELGKAIESEYDPVFDLQRAGQDSDARDIPVVHCRRGAVDELIRAARGESLSDIEKKIDEKPAPHSFELSGWRLAGQITVDRDQSDVKNVVAVLEGEGPLADETIIIGAHYDHLGYGGPGSAAPGNKDIHNGADDNGSGTATLIEIARRLAALDKKLPRRIVFIAFTGEERGLLGSAAYAKDPLVPLDKTVAMLNLDMVGRLQNNKMIVQGIDTAKELTGWLEEANRSQVQPAFELIEKTGGFGPSDHATFYAKDIPVLHFFTGTHSDYHKPSDDAEKLDIGGMRRTAELVSAVALKIAEASVKPTFQQSKEQPIAGRGGSRPYFGSIPDFSSTESGYALSGVAKGSPADKGGIKGGDVIVQFGESKIGNLEDIDGALRKFKAGDKVPVTVKRGDAKMVLEVILGAPK
jgi:hypothetical protein